MEKTGGEHLPVQPDCIVRPHHHVKNYYDDHVSCGTGTSIGDALFTAGISCLSRAKSQIQCLEVACAMTGSLSWKCLLNWKDLDLSQLERFEMLPFYKKNIHNWKQLSQYTASAVDAVLQKCSHTLKEFSQKSDCPMKWPGDVIIGLSSLSKLSLGSGPLEPHNLRAWLAEMPSLEHFELLNTSLSDVDSEPEYHRWRQVFDGIREHKNDMYIYFVDVVANYDVYLSLEFDTSDLEGYLEELEGRDYGWEEIEKSLPSYLSGEIEWNKDLGEYFSRNPL